MAKTGDFCKAFGPGIIFAGSCVGVSHLVQATRAGASYGLVLLIPVLLALLLKYPAFRFATQYTASTGKTLVEGYRNLGKGWLWLYVAFLSMTSVFGAAAISLVTAALAKAAFGINIPDLAATVLMMLICAAILAMGHFHLLEKVMKFFVLLLAVTTLVAMAAVVPGIDLEQVPLLLPEQWTIMDFAFLVALLGWMPTPMDVTVAQSLWTSAKINAAGEKLTMRALLQDFNVGYIGTAVLAICFVVMGAGLIYGSGTAIPNQPAVFAAMIIGMYEQSIGNWIGPIIGICAFAVMFSTLLSLFDGIPRTFGAIAVQLLHGKSYEEADPAVRHRWFNLAMLVICVLALCVLFFFMGSFKAFIDFATSVAFLTAPLFAWMNYRAVTSNDVAEQDQPQMLMRVWSYLGILAMVLMGAGFIYLKLVS